MDEKLRAFLDGIQKGCSPDALTRQAVLHSESFAADLLATQHDLVGRDNVSARMAMTILAMFQGLRVAEQLLTSKLGHDHAEVRRVQEKMGALVAAVVCTIGANHSSEQTMAEYAKRLQEMSARDMALFAVNNVEDFMTFLEPKK